jgi:hypothetical protein
MKHNSWLKVLPVVLILVGMAPGLAVAEQTQYSEKDYYFYEPGPIRQSTLYIDGSVIELETGSLTYPVVGSDLSRVTPAAFREMARQEHAALENNPNKIVVSPGRTRQGGLNIVFNCVSVPPAAIAALDSVATYIEHLFTDTVTITMNISFASLAPGVLGMAQRFYAGNPTYTLTRSSLVADMDGDDSIQTWLPTGATIPVRYNYSSATVTNEDRVYFVVAPYNAVIGYYPSLASNITFSTNITWDYDPSDGVSGFCFQSVAAHEIGHVLGFTSGASGYMDIDVLDIYRFQRSDGAGNYNPDSWSEFQTTARMVDLSPGNDDVNSDMINVEYQMSDGSPYQASHFSQNNVDAIMQPAFSSGQTYYPNFFQVPDRDMFDAIGWDYIFNYYLTINIQGLGSVDMNPDTVWHPAGTAVALTAIPDSGWMFYLWGGGLTGSQNPDTVIMDYDKSVTASFLTEFVTLTITINGNGTVNLDPYMTQYPRGTEVELTAIPDSAWVFSHWGGNLWGSQNPDTIIMDANKNVSATFVPDTYVEENKLIGAGVTHFNITPNPTSGKTDIRYQISDNSNATLEIYDATGQLVKSFDLESSIMNHESAISWYGDDNAGRKLPGGVYFVKFRAGDYKETQKLLLIR